MSESDGALRPLVGVQTGAAMCVLASGSAGNCTAIVLKRDGVERVVLIDLGLSPRRTFALLAERGLRPDQIDGCILTHLDTDHFRAAWMIALPRHAKFRLHAAHAGELRRLGMWDGAGLGSRVAPFDERDGGFDLDPGVTVRPRMMSHDDEGVSTLRIDMPGVNGGVLGFATDLGRVTADLVAHMRADYGHGAGVDALAMESNYCPRMQIASSRPEFLKRRIMGGRGHLSNQEAAEAVQAIGPREHVVLLHLSRECNHPSIAMEHHAGADYAVTVAEQERPSRWVRLRPSGRVRAVVMSDRLRNTATLWS